MGKEMEFLEACREGNLPLVQQLFYGKSRKLPFSLSKNGLPLTQCKDAATSSTPLQLAALNGRREVVEFLLQNKANITLADAQGCLPVHLASWNGHADIVDILLKYDASGSTVNALTNARETSMHFAAQYGHNDVAGTLIKNDADPTIRNNNGESALDLAAKNGRKEIVELLLMTHPQLVLNNSFVSAVDRVPQFSPLHLAARNGKTEIVRLLIDAGFDINLLTEEGTALHSASLYGKLDVVKLLLERGINVDAKDTNGRTVLQLLEEHRTRKSGTLSQSIKHLDVWQNCVTLIEGVGKSKTSSLSSSPVPRSLSVTPQPPSLSSTSSVYQNGSNCLVPPQQPTSVWMSLPPDCAERLLDEQKLRNAAAAEKLKTLTIRTDDLLSPHHQMLEDSSICSTISLTPDASPVVQSPNSTMSRNSFGASSPISSHAVPKPKKTPKKQCTYQPAPIASGYDNVPDAHTAVAATGYDNVPSNAIGYDNAPPPGCPKMWTHECSDDCVNTNDDNCDEQDPGRATPIADIIVQEQFPPCLQIPVVPVAQSGQRLAGLTATETTKSNTSPTQKSPNKCRVTWVGNYDNVPEIVHEPASAKTRRTQSESGATTGNSSVRKINDNNDDAVIEQTIQLIERSTTDIEEVCRSSTLPRPKHFTSVSVNSPKLQRTEKVIHHPPSSPLKAPLAQFDVEDLGTSTEGDAFLFPGVKSPTSPSQVPPLKTPSEPPPSVLDSEFKISKKIRPLSEELLRQSPPSSDSSRRVSSSASAKRPPSSSSAKVRPSLLLVDGETQVDSTTGSSECCNSSSECSCSEGSRCSLVVDGVNTATSTSNFPPFPFADDNSGGIAPVPVARRPPKTLPKSQSITSPIDEQAEWRKIDEIFQSYGSAISRLSVFDNEIEPMFTSYLKSIDAGSGASGRVSVDSRNGNATSPKQRVIERWLTSIGLQCYCKNFYEHGFDRLEFLKYTVDRHVLRYIGVHTDVDCDQMLRSLLNLPYASPKTLSANNFQYISDWLHAMGCQDALGYFARQGIDSMKQIMNLTEDDLLNVIGIPLFGHRRRLAWSIVNSIFVSDNNNTDVGYGSNATTPPTSTSSTAAVWLHSPDTLTGDGVSYVAHYLGSTEIRDDVLEENLELEEFRRTESTRKAICELKDKMRDNAKIPEVMLQIRYTGVCLSDAKTQHLLCEHFVQNIHCVCQDQRDMNCFAYNTKDGSRHFCHVFSVFTSDLAREIILTLGQAFEVAYQKALETGRV